MLDVVGLESLLQVGAFYGVLVDEVAVLVVEHRHVEVASIEVATQAGFIAFALFRLQARVAFYPVALFDVLKLAVHGFGSRGAETFGVLAIPGVVVVEGVGQAKFGRDAVPLLVRVVLRGRRGTGGLQATQELLGEPGLHARVVVTSARHEGPVVPADFILHEQAVGVHGRVREVADQGLAVCRALGASARTT
ncbi:hypothetical protein D3C72_1243050 [compost metagenome]